MDLLPDELVLNIMRLAKISTLGTLSSTCKRFNKLYRDDIIWQQKYKELCGLLVRPVAWRKYPWFLSVKTLLTKKYNLKVYKGYYNNYYKGILVSDYTDSGPFILCDIINYKDFNSLQNIQNIQNIQIGANKIYLVKNVVKWARWCELGLHARILSDLSSPAWWFDLFDKNIHNKSAITLVLVE